MKSKYKRLSHTVWYCQYHIVFCPKYRYPILKGKVDVLVRNYFYQLCGQKDQVTTEEINIQSDHVHMVMSVPPKYSVSDMMRFLKGKTALKLFHEQKELTKQYWVDTYGHEDTEYRV